ncbi:Hypothetical predicted protein [Lecanosticta acicola]|uniref:DUF1996 domain-containing protein n=1 Tax=Lecanosticta acicola TaxID=111012 RepID=A0AAI9E7N4_9PEZI|nr:Hypothetical predicted protein [Lecanosticta acicola]
MKSVTVATALACAGSVSAFWRMPCRSVTGYGRLDPLVNPGSISDHVHAIHGGGAFGASTDFKALTADGTCTSCEVTQDHSAYWTPSLYFQYSNGTTVMVPQVGGMLAYYLYYLEDVVAFPEGFAMIAGNPTYRNFTGDFPDAPLSSWPTDPTDQFFLQQRALGFNCLNYAKTPEASLYRHTFPEKSYMDANCLDGLRLELAFPSCGKKGVLDSSDHRSHVAYPSLVKEGNCPEGFDVHYPFIFFETIWATENFAGEDGQFLLSTGDPVGTSYHGDFIMGWESADFLQKALDTCQNQSGEISDCPLFDIQADSECAKCTFDVPAAIEGDDCHGPRDGLPVDVPIQYGPEPATKYNVAGVSGQATSSIPKTSAPATYSQSAAPYSPANPASTSTAQGGIVAGQGEASKAHAYAPSSEVTSAPAYTPSSSKDDCVSTTYITKGNEVIEVIIQETEVTVTATAQPTAASSAEAYHKRHLEKHQHHRF